MFSGCSHVLLRKVFCKCQESRGYTDTCIFAVIPCPKYASASWAEDRSTDDLTRNAPVDSVGWKGATDFCSTLTQIDRDAGKALDVGRA
jgi:hypothetical protein